MVCPNCNQEHEGARCPNCGRPAFNAANRVVAVLIAIFLVLPLACVGACSVWIGANMVIAPKNGPGDLWFFPLVIGAFAIPAFVGLAYLVAKLWRG